MKTLPSGMRAARSMILAAVVLCSGSPAAAQFSLFEAAGGDALGFVRVDAPSDLLGKIDGLISPLGLNSRMILPVLGEQIFANPALSGMDLSQPWFVVLLDPARHTAPYAFSFQAANAAQFVSGIGGTGLRAYSINPETAASRIKEFTQETARFDREGYLKAVEADQNPDLQDYRRKETRRLFIGVSNRLVIGADDRDLVDKALRTETPLPQGMLTGDVIVRLRPETLARMVTEALGSASDPASATPPPAAAVGGMIPGLPDIRDLALAATDALAHVTGIEQAFELGAGRLRIRFGIETAPGSGLRDWATRQPAIPESLMAYVPEDSIGVVEHDLAIAAGDLRTAMRLSHSLQASGAPGEPQASLPDDLVGEWASVLSGPALTAYLPNPPGQGGIRTVSILRIQNPDEARATVRRVLEDDSSRSWFAAGQIPGNISAEFRREVAQFQGYPVDRLGFIEPGADADPLVRQGWEGLKVATGGSPVLYVTCIPGHIVHTMGAQGLPTLNQTLSRLLEKRPTRFTGSPRYQSHLGRVPPNAQIRFWFAVAEYSKAVIPAVSAQTALPIDPSALIGNRQLDISGHARIQEAAITADIVLPAGDIVGILQQLSGAWGTPSSMP